MNTFIKMTASAVAISTTLLFVARSGDVTPEAPPMLQPDILLSQRCSDPNSWKARIKVFRDFGNAYADIVPDRETALRLSPKTVATFAYDISTENADAQNWFDTGMSHMANFNHGEAVEAFREGQKSDPNCAMCFWGEGFALGSNINIPFNPEIGQTALTAAKKAQSLLAGASGHEKALADALVTRYAMGEEAFEEKADAFADEMDKVARDYPEDDYIQILAAEANMDTQPWDYWVLGTNDPKGRTARTVELLEKVIDRSPDFPPAIHLYIHITEASTDPFRAETHADRLGEMDLGLGHLAHMPSHTYYRLGRWHKSLASNIKAVETDAAYVVHSDPTNLYQYIYYPHNVHFAMTTAQMGGQAEVAKDMSGRLGDLFPHGSERSPAIVEMIKVAPYFQAVQFDDPSSILELASPSDAEPLRKAMWHYARGEAFARMEDFDKASSEMKAISALTDHADIVAMWDAEMVPAPDVLRIAAGTVKARVMAGKGDLSGAITQMEDVVQIQASLPYMEPPYWYYPSRQTLGALLYRNGQYDRAEWEFYQALVESPNNAWVLYGLSESYKANGDKRAAKYTRSLFKDAWMGGRRDTPDMKKL